MKRLNLIYVCAMIIGFYLLSGCGELNQHPYSQLSSESFLAKNQGIKSTLEAAYQQEGEVGFQRAGKILISTQDLTTDIMFESSGYDHRFAVNFINFSWDPSTSNIYGAMWEPRYLAIRDANTILDNIKNAQISDRQKEVYGAEARFIRAICYYHLYLLFGPIPLRTSTNQPLELSRAPEDSIKTFIASELKAVIPNLPDPGNEKAYGRANKGAAQAFLCKFYLNTKQWQKSADMAKKTMDIGYYELYPNYFQLFHIENERNKEFIWVRQAVAKAGGGPGASDISTNWPARVFPPSFAKNTRTGLIFKSNWANFGAQWTMQDGFYNSFPKNDKRKSLILTEYVNADDKTVSLLNNNNIRPLKYWPDPDAISGNDGNDLPEIRYADILLSRAEAINELQGPNQESINLINRIRERASLNDITLSQFPSKDSLRDQILKERGWEFYCEGKRRDDLIRMGKFIKYAHNRGHSNAQSYMKLFPIPQQALDSNPKLKQNPGY